MYIPDIGQKVVGGLAAASFLGTFLPDLPVLHYTPKKKKNTKANTLQAATPSPKAK